MSFSENLQFVRTWKGLTQEQLAERLNVSRQSVSKWESSASFPEMDTLLQLCDLFSVDLDTLLRGSVEESMVEDTAHYNAFMNGYSWRLSLSVGGILAGVALLILLCGLGVHEMIATALFLLILTIAVVVMIASGIQEDNFRKKYPVIEDFYTEEEKELFHQKCVWYIAGGVGAILFAVVAMLLFFVFFPEQEPYESIASAGLLLIIAGAAVSFVYAGMQDEKYKIWKYNRDNNPTPEVKQRKQLIGTICAVIMIVAAAIYVGLGFTQKLWDSAFWVFPVGGILCGAVAVILDPYKGED